VGDGSVQPTTSVLRARAAEIDARMGAAFVDGSTPMSVLDPDGRLDGANAAFCSLLGIECAELLGTQWEHLIHPDDREAVSVPLHDTLVGRAVRGEIEHRVVTSRGSDRWCRTTVTRLKTEMGDQLLLETVDVTSRYELEERTRNAEDRIRDTTIAFQEELRRLAIAATTDQGSGLKNRRGFFALAEHELSVAQRLGHSLMLIFFDLDRLKLINDTLGHIEGDRAISDTADLLSSTFRESDIVARLGGDEFCVLALGPPNGLAQTMKRFESALDKHNRTAGRRYRLSLSYGVAFFDPADGSTTLDELMSLADASMYENKQSRRSA
jgi:diguanylate cyclase (GGDEF)-like protein/PAS domain S-box-containing protein